MSVFESSRAGSARWWIAAMLAVSASSALADSSSLFSLRPDAPKPAPFTRNQLPAVFNKPAPTSLEDLRAIQDTVTGLVARVSPAVVAVELGNASGSGVVISPDGLVLTAGHVAERAGRRLAIIFPDGKSVPGKTLGIDEEADTGLIQITAPGPWPYVSVGDLDHSQRGDWTLAIGNPGGFDAKRSLVTRLGRIIRIMPGVVQTDCTIFPGDSGGPLFDMSGRVIAIHTAISSSTVENFHVPITEFFATWPELSGATTQVEERPQAYVGASVTDDAAGCRLAKIEKNSPAAKAGLKTGDVVLKVEGRDISVAASFKRWLAESAPGDTLRLQIKRGNKILSLPITLQSPPDKN